MNAIEPSLAAVLDRKMALRGNTVYQPTPIESVSKQLDAFLADQLDGAFVVHGLSKLTGGASMEQYVFSLERPDTDEPTTRMILRMSPLCSVIETCRLREFQIIAAVQGTVPAPRAFFVAPESDAFGKPALISSFDEGVTAPTDGGGNASGLGTAYGSSRAALAPQFVRHLAALHTLDWSAKDLSSLEVPRQGTTDAVDWRIALWDRVWREDGFEAHPTVALTSAWLWEHRPPVDHVSLVHGDYRNGNFLFLEGTGEMTAILDWEAGHLGDRHMDLAYAMLPGYGTLGEDGTYYCAGLVEKQEFIREYERHSGLSVDPERLRYYTVLNMYWAVIACSGTAPRLAAEHMTHLDTMMNLVPGLAMFFIGELNAILREDLG
jgi:aminoglycoside phosphotransferase (APT) family kinase protein